MQGVHDLAGPIQRPQRIKAKLADFGRGVHRAQVGPGPGQLGRVGGDGGRPHGARQALVGGRGVGGIGRVAHPRRDRLIHAPAVGDQHPQDRGELILGGTDQLALGDPAAAALSRGPQHHQAPDIVQQAGHIEAAPLLVAQQRGHFGGDDAQGPDPAGLVLEALHPQDGVVEADAHADAPQGVQADPGDRVVQAAGGCGVEGAAGLGPDPAHQAGVPLHHPRDLQDVGRGLAQQLVQLAGHIRKGGQVELIRLDQAPKPLDKGAVCRGLWRRIEPGQGLQGVAPQHGGFEGAHSEGALPGRDLHRVVKVDHDGGHRRWGCRCRVRSGRVDSKARGRR